MPADGAPLPHRGSVQLVLPLPDRERVVSHVSHASYASHATSHAGGKPEGTSLCGRRPCVWASDRAAAYLAVAGDSPQMVTRKTVWMLLLVMMMATNTIAGLGTMGWESKGLSYACGMFACISLALTVILLVRRVVDTKFMLLTVVVVAMNITIGDLMAMPTLWRVWALFILVVDVLLVAQAPRWLQVGVVAWVSVWLCVAELEYFLRFGLLDIQGIGMDAYHERGYRFDCERPPCEGESAGSALAGLAPQLLVFLMDFLITRRFSEGVRREQQRMAATITAAQRTACSLSRFDLVEAEDYLTHAGRDLDPELLVSFRTLLSNLSAYRPYLPEAFFTEDPRSDGDGGASSFSPHTLASIPGANGDPVAICFTDIRKSTELWECTPDAMALALATHNQIIRAAIAANSGYEVKTVGDSFMIAFNSAVDAVSCGIAIQTAFADPTVFPTDLRRSTMPDGYHALTARIGVHTGTAKVERNVLTGRYDYFGPAVNKCARVESCGLPGAVTATLGVMELVLAAPESLPARTRVLPFAEARTGRGLSEPLYLAALLPGGTAPAELERAAEFCGGNAQEELAVCDITDDSHGMDDKLRQRSMTHMAVAHAVSQMQRIEAQHAHAGMRLATPDTTGGRVTELSASASALSPSSPGWLSRHDTDFMQVESSVAAPPLTMPVPISLLGRGSVGVVKLTATTPIPTLEHSTSFLYDDAKSAAHPPTRASTVATARLQHLHQLVSETKGTIGTAVNDIIILSWGVYGDTSQHVNWSVRFLVRMFQAYATRAPGRRAVPFHAGLCTGRVSSTRLTASEKLGFVTLLGPSVDIGMALCAAAAELKTEALVASVAPTDAASDTAYHTHEMLRRFVRPVDRWSLASQGGTVGGATFAALHSPTHSQTSGHGCGGGYLDTVSAASSPRWTDIGDDISDVLVYELRLSSLSNALYALDAPPDALPPGWSAQYARAYAARDMATLRTLATDDATVAAVVQMLEQGTHLQYALTGPVWRD